MKKIFLFSGLFLIFGMLSGIGSNPSINTWYNLLEKSPLTPQNWAFPVAWIILYIIIGASFALILQSSGESKNKALLFFTMSFAGNLLWSTLFFVLQSPLAGLIDIIIIDISLLFAMIYIKKLNSRAFILLIPYLLWLLFATYLNAFIFIYN